MNTTTEVSVLRAAALIVRKRSSKPDSITVRVMMKMLRDLADKIESGER